MISKHLRKQKFFCISNTIIVFVNYLTYYHGSNLAADKYYYKKLLHAVLDSY